MKLCVDDRVCHMKYFICFIRCIPIYFVAIFASAAASDGELPRPETYIPTVADIRRHKAFYDDPRPILKTFGPKQVLPQALYSRLTYDVEKMQNVWSDLVGFRAPDLVGKIAPDIVPGHYSFKDLEKYPGFKMLMPPVLYRQIRPGGPPLGGSVPEFEVIPTRQYYWALPIALASKRQEDKIKLDSDGYLIPETWQGGYPFPKPTGKFRAQQIMYNIEKRYTNWSNNNYSIVHARGYTKDLRVDFDGTLRGYGLRLAGRVMAEPYGWYDKRAENGGEYKTSVFYHLSPQENFGMVQTAVYYLDPKKTDRLLVYPPAIRRMRKVSGTDTQDQGGTLDQIYDDMQGFSQKLSPTRYPYTYELIDEREFLVRAPTLDGSEYIDANGLALRNVKMERRPLYVVQLLQQDKTYVYSKRIFFVDKETFLYYQIENYDQEGRLYRSFDMNWSFFPEMGKFSWCGAQNVRIDHLDKHSTMGHFYDIPAFWSRKDFSLKKLAEGAK